MAQTERRRLDSWKAIAEYLNRDVGTARRWEKSLGLPVRRVPGSRGHSVFAYTAEIDAWLAATPTRSTAPTPPASTVWRGWYLLVPLCLAAIGIAWLTWTPSLSAEGLRVTVTDDGVLAFDANGRERWRRAVAPGYLKGSAEVQAWSRVVTSDPAAVYVATTVRQRPADGVMVSGEVSWLNLDGTLRHAFAFDDEVTVHGTSHRPPWVVTSFAIDGANSDRRVAVAAHHYIWYPSLVTVLDHRWQRRGTFHHAGWIEAVHWLSPDRLLIGGFSNAQDGGMVALLDPSALDGQGPEPTNSDYHCDNCGSNAPRRIVVFPRTELNLVTRSRFNRALLQVLPDRIIARTTEVYSHPNEPPEALYELSPSLDLVRASFTERYWQTHRALEADGTLQHTRETCPFKGGPPEIRTWEPATGWRTTATSRPAPSAAASVESR